MEVGGAQGALPIVLPQAAQVTGVTAQEVHCRQLQGGATYSTLAVLENPGLQVEVNEILQTCMTVTGSIRS